jgi:hypothetical protein
MTDLQTTTRNADLNDLVALLRDNHTRKLDVVAPATCITADDQANLVLAGTEAEITDDGVTPTDGTYRPTRVCDDGLASRLGIPAGYLRRLRDQHPQLWAQNVRGWLGHADNADRKYLVRCLRGDAGGAGVARAFLSDSFAMIDHLDVLMAALDGIRQAGIAVDIPPGGCDLTDSRMYVKIQAPQVAALAPVLLAGYRSPFAQGETRFSHGGWDLAGARAAAANEGQGYEDGAEPVVYAGLVLTNSEVGTGMMTIAPELVIQVCRNGLTMAGEALRRQHLGAKLDAGVIRWSADTEKRNLAVVTGQARDAVATFLDVDYLTHKINELEQTAGKRVEDPAKTIEVVSRKLKYDDATQRDILRHFTLGGQATAGGVMQAVTSVAQIVPDADLQARMESDALAALELAYAAA